MCVALGEPNIFHRLIELPVGLLLRPDVSPSVSSNLRLCPSLGFDASRVGMPTLGKFRKLTDADTTRVDNSTRQRSTARRTSSWVASKETAHGRKKRGSHRDDPPNFYHSRNCTRIWQGNCFMGIESTFYNSVVVPPRVACCPEHRLL